MSLGYGEGVALGMLVGDSYAARGDANAQRSRANRLESEVDDLERQVAALKAELKKAKSHSTLRERQASAGFIMMNGMVKAMEFLPVELREKFKTEALAYASNRMNEIDAEHIAEAKKTNEVALTIAEVFAREPEAKAIGFKLNKS